MKVRTDDEMQAMRRILELLSALTPTAKQRVLRYVTERLDEEREDEASAPVLEFRSREAAS
jgi:hypothetical protein